MDTGPVNHSPSISFRKLETDLYLSILRFGNLENYENLLS